MITSAPDATITTTGCGLVSRIRNVFASFFDLQLYSRLRAGNLCTYFNHRTVYSPRWVPSVLTSRLLIDVILIRRPELCVQLIEIQLTASWLQVVVYYIFFYIHALSLFDWLRMRRIRNEASPRWFKFLHLYDYFERGWIPTDWAAGSLAARHNLTLQQADQTLKYLSYMIWCGLGAYLGFHGIVSGMVLSTSLKWIRRGNWNWHYLPFQLATGISLKYAFNIVSTTLGLSFIFFYSYVYFISTRVKYINEKIIRFYHAYPLNRTSSRPPFYRSDLTLTDSSSILSWTGTIKPSPVTLSASKKRGRNRSVVERSRQKGLLVQADQTIDLPQSELFSLEKIGRTQTIRRITQELSSLITDMDLSRRLISINFSTMYTGSVLSGTMYVFLIPLANATDLDRLYMYAFFSFSVIFMMLPPNLFGQMLINQVSYLNICHNQS